MSEINKDIVSANTGLGKLIADKAIEIGDVVGNDRTIAVNAIVVVLSILLEGYPSNLRNAVIDGIPANIRANMDARRACIQ